MLEAISSYFLLCCVILLANAWLTLKLHRSSLLTLTNQCLKGLATSSIPGYMSIPASLMIYLIPLITPIGCGMYVSIVLLSKTEPYQQLFGQGFLAEISSCGLYVTTALFTIGALEFILIGGIIVIIAAITLTKGALNKIYVPGGSVSQARFRLGYMNLLAARIITGVTDVLIGRYVGVFVYVGVMYGCCLAYMVITMKSKLQTFLLIAAAVSLCVFSSGAMALTYMAAVPVTNIDKFRRVCRRKLCTKQVRAMLAAIPSVVGFRVGAYGIAYEVLGLKICNDVFESTTTLILLSR